MKFMKSFNQKVFQGRNEGIRKIKNKSTQKRLYKITEKCFYASNGQSSKNSKAKYHKR